VGAVKLTLTKDGTRAYKTEIRWHFGGILWIKSIVVSTYKDGKCVFIGVHPTEGDTIDMAWIPESLSFE
jgi:hypothetical protein